MKTFRGYRLIEKLHGGALISSRCVVQVEEGDQLAPLALRLEVWNHSPTELAPLALRLEVWNHSPTGFEWGYGGSGPAQLALAILVELTRPNVQEAVELHQAFKRDVIARLPRDGWSLTEAEVFNWIVGHYQAQNPE